LAEGFFAAASFDAFLPAIGISISFCLDDALRGFLPDFFGALARLRVRRRHSGEVLPSGRLRSRALRVALDAVEGSRRLHRYDEDQAESRRREAGVRFREDRSEFLSGELRSERRHKPVAQQNGLVDNRR
jgi:hypothetical protein